MKSYSDAVSSISNTKANLVDLIWFIVIPILNLNYILASKITKNGHDLSISLDKVIPFKSIFILPYVYWYIYITLGLILILIKSRKEYIRAFLSIFVGMIVCYIIYFIFPTEISRPIIHSKDVLSRLVSLIYSMDRPVNCFPSLHVLATYLIMRYTKRKYSNLGFFYTQIVGVLIILSILFVKQHFVVDIFAAIILCEVIIFALKRVDDEVLEGILNIPYRMKKKIQKYSLSYRE